MPKDEPLDYTHFVSEVAQACLLSVEPSLIDSVLKLLWEKSMTGSLGGSWLWNTYHRHMLTPSEAATEIVNELIMAKPVLEGIR